MGFLRMRNCIEFYEIHLTNSNNISLHAMGFGSKMDKPGSSQEGGVVGLNFHQSKEILISETNGSIYTVC